MYTFNCGLIVSVFPKATIQRSARRDGRGGVCDSAVIITGYGGPEAWPMAAKGDVGELLEAGFQAGQTGLIEAAEVIAEHQW